jgi:ubiquinone/menaquinone biosynthesis C-methylase UbiE
MLFLVRSVYAHLIHWAFERLYHELAWSYDLVAAVVSRGYWRRWSVAVVPYLRGEQVLELGFGTGYLQLALSRRGLPHAGIDASAQMIRQARRRLRRQGYAPRIARARAQKLPFADARFSDVVATFPAPYIVAPETLNEVRRVLKPGGQLLIVDGGSLEAGLYEAAVGLAYRATLQDGEEDRYHSRLERSGFSMSVRRIAVGRSSVALVVAQSCSDTVARS